MSKELRSIGNYPRSWGWSEDLVAQAASESDRRVCTGPTTHGNSHVLFVCLYTDDERGTGPFFKKAIELGAKMTGPI